MRGAAPDAFLPWCEVDTDSLDAPGAVVDFELHGVVHGRWRSFSGSFLPSR